MPKITAAQVPFEVPASWEWCRLGDVAIDVSYGTSQKAHGDVRGIPILRMGNITRDGGLTWKNLKYVSRQIKDLPRLLLRSGDILFNRTNSYELVGKSAVFRRDTPFTLASYLIRVRLFEDLVPEYAAYFINSATCRTAFIEPGTTQQNGQANFNGTKLKAIPIPLPPHAEQVAIVERVEALMAKSYSLEAQIGHSRIHAANLLQAILRDAFEPPREVGTSFACSDQRQDAAE
jgi:type I restriction enzyme, S subunit